MPWEMAAESTSEAAIGVVGGSGLYEMEGFEEITVHTVRTPFGDPSERITMGRIGGRRVCFLARHGMGHRLMPHEINHRANIWALRSLGVRWVISVSAVGSLREGIAPRDIVVPDQLIDRTGSAARHTFFGYGIVAHVGFADPYCGQMREILRRAATESGAALHDCGTYLCMNGPAFSTRAEARFHRQIGADIIGMTNAPEARLCREAEIAAATLALVTDYDCWKDDETAVEVDAVMENLQANSELAKRIVRAAIDGIPETPDAPAHRALATAIFTPRSAWPADTCARLAPILGTEGNWDSAPPLAVQKPASLLPWYFQTSVMVIALLSVGPLALPAVWWHPKMRPVWKVIVTILTILLTWATVKMTIGLLATLREAAEMMQSSGLR